MLTALRAGYNKEDMQDAFENDYVYESDRVIAAKYYNWEHSESHVLKHMINDMDEGFFTGSENQFLLIYTYLSPCALRCADPNKKQSIIPLINKVLNKWHGEFALVFQKPCTFVFKCDINRDELKQSFINLEKSRLGSNILRCYKPETGDFRCLGCLSDKKDVAPECLEGSKSGQEGQASSSAGAKRPASGAAGSRLPTSRGRNDGRSSSRSSSRSDSRSSSRSSIRG